MYQNQISELERLTEEKYENIFNVYLDEDNRYYYNLLETINFPENLPDAFFTQYDVQPGDTLPLVSYKMFGTINIWWVIALANNINNPVEGLKTGTPIKIPNLNIIREIIKQINI